MKPLPWIAAEPYRIQRPGYESGYGDGYGMFLVRHAPTGVSLAVMANDADEGSHWWEHVSVSLPGRCPNWPEMDFIKRMFWLDDEAVMQLHVPRSDHRSLHPYCLHLWRPTRAMIPLPPGILVAPDAAIIGAGR